MTSLLSRVRRFRSREDGAITVEFVVWMPVMFLFLTLAVDVTMILHSYSYVSRVVHDENRRLSAAITSNTAEAESRIEAALTGFSSNAEASTSITGDIITSSVAIPAADLAVSPIFDGLTSFTIRVTASHLWENPT